MKKEQLFTLVILAVAAVIVVVELVICLKTVRVKEMDEHYLKMKYEYHQIKVENDSLRQEIFTVSNKLVRCEGKSIKL